jgi:hypothetical protein
MEILAGLIKLSSPSLLPAPWYNRPALGLISGTPVEVALIESAANIHSHSPSEAVVPPDIIVTPLKVSKLPLSSSKRADTCITIRLIYQTTT